jgi:hypothetical protein
MAVSTSCCGCGERTSVGGPMVSRLYSFANIIVTHARSCGLLQRGHMPVVSLAIAPEPNVQRRIRIIGGYPKILSI